MTLCGKTGSESPSTRCNQSRGFQEPQDTAAPSGSKMCINKSKSRLQWLPVRLPDKRLSCPLFYPIYCNLCCQQSIASCRVRGQQPADYMKANNTGFLASVMYCCPV